MALSTIPKDSIAADAIDVTKIADDAISEEHLDATAITGSTELAATPASTDELLVSDAGVLKRVDFSHLDTAGLKLISRSVNQGSGSSSAEFQGCFTTSFTHYLILIGACAVETNQANLQMRFLNDSNSALTDSNYTFGGEFNDAGNNTVDEIRAIGSDSFGIGPSMHNADATPAFYKFYCYNNTPTNTGDRPMITGTGIFHHEAQHDPRMDYFGGSYTGGNHCAGFTIFAGSGNISDHDIAVFGVKAF